MCGKQRPVTSFFNYSFHGVGPAGSFFIDNFMHIREAGEGGEAKPARYIYSAVPVPVIAYSAGLQSHRLSTIMAAKDR